MKTALIETHYHAEYLSTLIQLYPHCDVYTTKKVYDDLPESSKSLVSVFNFPGSSSISSFLSSIKTEDYDLCFVNTIQETMLDLPNWRDFKPHCKSVLTIHNLNAWHKSEFRLISNPFHSFDSWFSKKYLRRTLEKFENISVCYEPMVPVAKQYFGKPTFFIPFALAQESVVPEEHDDIWFVIPGTVSSKRRIYKPVIDAFNKLLDEHQNIRLYLLGKNEDELEFEETKDTEDRIITYDKSVPRDEYDKILRDSDFIIVPSVEFCNTINVTEERYGLTKSPNIHEAVKWRKPIVVPEHLQVPDNLLPCTIKYSDQSNLFLSLKKCLEFSQISQKYKKSALKCSQLYTPDNIRRGLSALHS